MRNAKLGIVRMADSAAENQFLTAFGLKILGPVQPICTGSPSVKEDKCYPECCPQ